MLVYAMGGLKWRVGRPLPFANPRFRSDMDERRDTAIEVEKTRGPLLVISGEDDGVWPSSSMANVVIGRLKLRYEYANSALEVL